MLLNLDQVCDRFEVAWRAGQRPRIEDFLGEITEPARPALLTELLRLDAAYRQLSEHLRPEDDRSPFFAPAPERQTLEAVLNELLARETFWTGGLGNSIMPSDSM